MKIGFFDSGLGGLTILKAVVEKLPQYDYEYYGDTAHLPYGDKSEEEVYQLTKNGVTHLFENDCVLVIIACNTASAETLRRLQDSFLLERYPNRRILGVIIPTVEAVIETNIPSVAVMATNRTVESKKYNREFAKFVSGPVVHLVATPGLVPLIEVGELEAAMELVYGHLENLLATGVTGLILGCTHYTLLAETITTHVNGKLEVFSQDTIIPPKLTKYLQRHPEMQSILTTTGARNIFLSADRPEYDLIVSHLLSETMMRA